MFFTFQVETTDTEGLGNKVDTAVMFILHGLRPDNSNWISLTVNGEDRFARWDPNAEELKLDRSVVLRFDQHIMRVVDTFDKEDLPEAVVAAIDALNNAGPEAAVELCDICGMLVPYRVIVVRTICACPRCRKKLQVRTEPGDDGPPF